MILCHSILLSGCSFTPGLSAGPTKRLAVFLLQTYLGKQSPAIFKHSARCFSQTFLAGFPCTDRTDTLFYSPYLTQKLAFLEAVFLHLIIFTILKLIISTLLSCHRKSFWISLKAFTCFCFHKWYGNCFQYRTLERWLHNGYLS